MARHTNRLQATGLIVGGLILLAACASDSGSDASDTTAAPAVTSTVAVARELVVPAVVNEDVFGASISGYIVEVDGEYRMCEGLTEAEPPGCLGQAIVISNGEVIDPIVFLGEPGAQYSNAEVVVTGDVVGGVLTIK